MKSGGIFALLGHRLRNIHVLSLPPEARAGIKSWNRAEIVRYLRSSLKPGNPRTLVARDGGAGEPVKLLGWLNLFLPAADAQTFYCFNET